MADPVTPGDCFARAAALLREAGDKRATPKAEAELLVAVADGWRKLGETVHRATRPGEPGESADSGW